MIYAEELSLNLGKKPHVKNGVETIMLYLQFTRPELLSFEGSWEDQQGRPRELHEGVE